MLTLSHTENSVLFISDLHLAVEKSTMTHRFLEFLQTRALKVEALYILGDLFDVWVGDDNCMPFINNIKQQLKQVTRSGVKIYLQRGNRDFLLGEKFCQLAGVILLEDSVVIDLFGVNTLLTHGDLLCTDDLAYQAFRKKSHTQIWQNNVLSKPLLLRLLVARWYRLRSFFHKQNKSQQMMDVNQHAVMKMMHQYQVTRLIHGHTHRPAIHDFTVGTTTAQRFVLNEWAENNPIKVLSWNQQGYELITL